MSFIGLCSLCNIYRNLYILSLFFVSKSYNLVTFTYIDICIMIIEKGITKKEKRIPKCYKKN